jgi:hypothetical protein
VRAADRPDRRSRWGRCGLLSAWYWPTGPSTGSKPSPHAPPPRQRRWDHARNAKAPAATFHRLGTTCGELPDPGSRVGESPFSNGEAHRWKAPRVQQSASLFAERRVKRPWRRWRPRKRSPSQAGSRARQGDQRSFVSSSLGRRGVRQNRASGGPRLRACAQAGPPGGLVMGTRQHVCTRRGRPLQPTSRRALRQQVSEPIGSGRSSRCEQSRRKAPGRAKAAWPLTRETSAGSLVGSEGERAQA